MVQFPQNVRSYAASPDTALKLNRIADRFSLSQKQRSLQARILGKLFSKEIAPKDLVRVLRINLNLSKKKAIALKKAIQKEVLEGIKKTRASVPSAKPTTVPKEQKPSPRRDSLKLGAGGLQKWVDDLIGELKLGLSPLEKSRLESAILTYIKDIRDGLETQDVLERDPDRGGVGLKQAKAQEIVKRLEKDFSEKDKDKIRRDHKPPLPLPKIEAAPRVVPERREMPTMPRIPEFPTPQPPPRVVSDVIEKEPPIPTLPPESARGLSIGELKNVSQLKELGLDNFKTGNPAQAAKELIEKARSLIGKNELERFNATQAWRASEPYGVYIAIGEESIAKDQTIKEIAQERARKNQPYLTEEEFNAIADVSKEFQY